MADSKKPWCVVTDPGTADEYVGQPANFIVTLRRPDGYEFNNGFDSIDDVREFMARAVLVLNSGETVSFRVGV